MSLLRYSVSTPEFPVLASADDTSYNQVTLTVLGTNLSSTAAQITSIDITIPFGSSAADLSPTVPTTPPAPENWTVKVKDQTKASITFTFTPDPSPASVTTTALAFQFPGMEVNAQPGSAEILVKENGSTTGQPRLFIAKFPATWGSITFSGDINVDYGGSPTLKWAGPPQATYQLTYYTPDLGVVNVPGGGPALPSTGSYPGPDDPPLALSEDTTFTLTVTDNKDQNHNTQAQWTVSVVLPNPEVLQFSGDLTFDAASESWSLSLNWTTQYATSVSIAGIADNLKPEYVGYQIPVTFDTIQRSYTLTAISGSNMATATIYLQMGQLGTIPVPTDLNPGMLNSTIAVNGDASLIALGCEAGILILKPSSLFTATSVQLLPSKSFFLPCLNFVASDSFLVAATANAEVSKVPGNVLVYETTNWTQVASLQTTIAASKAAAATDGSWIVLLKIGTCELYSFSAAQSTLTRTAVASIPSGYNFNGGLSLGVSTNGQNVFFYGAANSGSTPLNQEYSISDSSSQPFTFVSDLPLPPLEISFAVNGRFCGYPGCPVMLQTNFTGSTSAASAVVIDASDFTALSNVADVTSSSESAGQTVGAIGTNPLIFYAVRSDTEIGVFGPIGYSSTPPVSTGS